MADSESRVKARAKAWADARRMALIQGLDPMAVKRFVDRGLDAKAAVAAAKKEFVSSRKKQLTVNLPPELHTKLKLTAVAKGIPMQRVVGEALRKALPGFEKK